MVTRSVADPAGPDAPAATDAARSPVPHDLPGLDPSWSRTVIVADAVPSGAGTLKPQVVGAASEGRSSPAAGTLTPAEKAALLSREASGSQAGDGPVLAEEGPTHPALRWLRRDGDCRKFYVG